MIIKRYIGSVNDIIQEIGVIKMLKEEAAKPKEEQRESTISGPKEKGRVAGEDKKGDKDGGEESKAVEPKQAPSAPSPVATTTDTPGPKVSVAQGLKCSLGAGNMENVSTLNWAISSYSDVHREHFH